MPKETLEDLQNGYFLYQDAEGFRFGMDAVLLAHFVRLRKGEKVCDLGCGSGIIPLLLAAQYPEAAITGLEINSRSAELAQKSVDYNGLTDRVKVVCGDIRRAETLFGRQSFKVVVSNPPYLRAGSGRQSPNEQRAAARHEVLVTLREVAAAAGRLLTSSGRFYLVHRPERLSEILSACGENHLAVKKLRLVYPYADREASLVLLEAVKGAAGGMKALPPLIIFNKEGQYTEEVQKIYAPAPDAAGKTAENEG